MKKACYDHAKIHNPANHTDLITYHCNVGRAVCIQHGAADVKLEAKESDSWFDDIIMIEIGACHSVGQRSTIAQAAVNIWDLIMTLFELICGEIF